MRKRAIFSISRGIVLFLACFGFAFGTAWATTGIRLEEGPTLVSITCEDGSIHEGNPPCDRVCTSTFEVTIGNTHPFLGCGEKVDPIIKANPLPPALGGDGEGSTADPGGSADIEGFKLEEDGELSDELKLDPDGSDVEAGELRPFFVDAKTGPVDCTELPGGLTAGGDFLSASLKFVVCDFGGGCDFFPLGFPDPEYPTCEDPKIISTISLEANDAFCPGSSETGTGIIRGKVTKSNGDPVENAEVTVRRGCGATRFERGPIPTNCRRGPRCRDDLEPGEYEFPGLPFPTTYDELKVREGGICATASVTIPSGGSVTHDITNFETFPECPRF